MACAEVRAFFCCYLDCVYVNDVSAKTNGQKQAKQKADDVFGRLTQRCTRSCGFVPERAKSSEIVRVSSCVPMHLYERTPVKSYPDHHVWEYTSVRCGVLRLWLLLRGGVVLACARYAQDDR